MTAIDITPLEIAVSLAVGLAMGALYFVGLWLTVHRVRRVGRPLLWAVLSFVVRLTLVLAGFYAVMGGRAGRWERVLVCLAGFIVARFAVVYLLGPAADRHAREGDQSKA